MRWTLFKRCSNNLFQEQIFHMYIYGCLCWGSLTFLRSSICSLLLSFDSGDTLGHGGGGSGDGVGLVEVFQNLKSIRRWERIWRYDNFVTLTDTSRGVPESCCDISLARFKDWTKKLAGSMFPYRIRLGATWNQNVNDNDQSKDFNFQEQEQLFQKCTSAILARSSGSLS